MRPGAALIGVLFVGTAATGGAGEHPWRVGLLVGSAAIHGKPRDGWIEARVGRSVTPGGLLSADLGVGASSADTGFTTLTTGLELNLLPRAPVSPFVRGEVGLLGEWDLEYGGTVTGAGGGLVLRLSPRLGLRGGASWNTHGGQSGPTMYYGGLQYRW